VGGLAGLYDAASIAKLGLDHQAFKPVCAIQRGGAGSRRIAARVTNVPGELC